MRIRKRIFSLTLALCLLLGVAPPIRAATLDSGTCGDNLTWTLDDSGTLTISGTGPMADGSVWTDYAPDILAVNMEYGLTTIGDTAFAECAFSEVSIPGSVAAIGPSAFLSCRNLTSATIPQSVTSIGEYAFTDCNSLTEVAYGGTRAQWSAVTIGNYNDPLLNATIHCTDGDTAGRGGSSGGGTSEDTLSGTCGDNLTWTLVNGILTISGTGPMTNYSNASDAPWYDRRTDITAIVIESGVTTIGDNAFHGCEALTRAAIPDSVTSIGDAAFMMCGLTSVAIPNSVTYLGVQAFDSCAALKSVTIPDSVKTVQSGAFEYCAALTSVTIPTSVTSIDGAAFDGCDALTDVYYSGTEAQWETLKSKVADNNDPLLNAAIHYNSSGGGTSGDTLSGTCGDNLTWTLANGVLTISGTGPMVLYNQSDAPWYDYRENITSIIMESGVTSVGSFAFCDCSILTSAAIPEGVTSIAVSAFSNCSALTSVTIPDSVPYIQVSAFEGCSALRSVTISNTLTGIHSSAFNGCNSLADVYYSGTEAQWETLKSKVADNNDPLLNATIHFAGKGDDVTECHVFFEANNGGGEMPETTVTPDQTTGAFRYVLPQCGFTPPDGMAFRAWSVTRYDADSNPTVTEGQPGDELDLTGVVSLGLTAQWETITTTHTVIFNGNGGLPQSSAYVVEYNATVPQPATVPTRDGYEFTGWFTDAEMTAPFDFSTLITENMTLFAGWKVLSPVADCTVTFDGNGGLPQSSAYVVEYNATVPQPATVPTRDGYEFTGWFTDAKMTAPFDFSTLITANMTLFAGWKETVDDNILASGYCGGEGDGTNLSWVLTNDGTLTISGSGAMADYGDGDAPWYDNRESVKTVVMESGVTSIGISAFYDCDGLTNVTIPDSVTSIGSWSFASCSGLTGVTIPDSVTSIGSWSFNFCSGLTGVAIPDSVTSIGPYAFRACSALKDVYYGGTKTQWATLKSNISIDNDQLLNATIHCTDGDIVNTSYVVTFEANGGGGSMSAVTVTDSTYTFPQCEFTPPDGMKFSGIWSVWLSIYTVNYSEAYREEHYPGETVTLVGDTTVLPVWEPVGESYTVTFDANGGVGVMQPVSVTAGASYTLPECAFTPPQGVTFWTWSVNGMEYAPGQSVSVSGNVTVTALWETIEDPYRVLESLHDMDGYENQTWHLAGPLSEFQTLTIDETVLTRGADYAAEDGSTKLNIPAGTFERFGEGTHSVAAEFQTSPDPNVYEDDGKRAAAEYYTVKPSGKVTIDASEINAAKAVKGVSHTARFRTNPRLNDNYYRFVVTDGVIPAGLTFHDGGYFTGVVASGAAASYGFTVGLQVRKDPGGPWPDAYSDTVQATIAVEEDTAANVETASDPGYELTERIPATIEQSGDTLHLISKGEFEEFTDFYIDGVKQVRGVDYQVRACLIDADTGDLIRLLDSGAITGTYLSLNASKLSVGTHSLNLEFVKTDSIGNKQTRNASQKVTVTPKAAPSGGGSSGGGGGGGSSSGGGGSSSRSSSSSGVSRVSTYSIKASSAANGSITLSAKSATAGTTVTVTVTPNSGYQISGVKAVDSKKNSVTLTKDGNKYTFKMPSRAVTVSATFSPVSYGVSAASAQHGKISLDKSSATSGATVNGTTTPDKGYLLSGLTVRDANGKSVKVETFDNGRFTFLMPSGRATVSATFAVKRLASFVDIQGPDWFFDDAEWAYNRGILQGTTAQYWEPQSLMSSITSIVTLERLDGVDLTPYDTGADDGLDNGAWYVAALRWANANNITLSDRPFGGRDALTRGEFAVMLSNYLRYRGVTASAPDNITFSDAATMTEDELNAFRILQQADVFRGYSDGSIRPKAYLSRAHLAALLHRLSAYVIQAETAGG